MIPRRLIRTVPEHTTDEVEAFWRKAAWLHPDWELVTYRDPINPAEFPLTSIYWDRCQNGAQLAGLVRLEALWTLGGIYLDSDVEVYRRLDPLCGLDGFAAWEDHRTVPDAVMGFTARHPAVMECLLLAMQRMDDDSTDWSTGNGAWGTGPGVTTTVLPDRDDVLLLPPQSFYPYHYSERHRRMENHAHPFTFAAHHWAASWLPEEDRK